MLVGGVLLGSGLTAGLFALGDVARYAGSASLALLLVGGALSLLDWRLHTRHVLQRAHRQRAHARQSRNLLKTLIETIPAPIFYKDAEGRYLGCNQAFSEYIGLREMDLVGKSVFDIAPQELAITYHQADQELLAAGESQKYEAQVRYANGQKRNVVFHKGVWRSADDKPEGMVGLFLDITELKQTEAALAKARDNAEKASQAKSEFLAVMSHEIRTPLNAMLGMTEVLSESELNDEQRKRLDLLHRAGESMMRLINDILDLSKVEAGRLKLELRPFDLEKMLRAEIGLIADLAQEKGLSVTLRLDKNAPKRVLGDTHKLRQVLSNLLGNAVKFTDQGEITVSAAQVDGAAGEANLIRFEVRDTGIGVQEEHQQEIFAPFAQEDESITRRYGGSGLGLSICRSLVEMMGGELAMQSGGTNGGSVFTFTVPLPKAVMELAVEASAAEARREQIVTATPTQQPQADAQPARLLLVEDAEDNISLMRAYLGKQPVELIIARNGQEGVDAFREQPVDLVLMDIQMPVKDGFTATREIRELEAEQGLAPTPVIAVTAHAFPEDIERCVDAGCDAHIPKPVRKKELLELIGRYANGGGNG
ncbi:putative multi-sensor hybrid histidine kinase [Magnetofaba australis IT-1]|uniref:Sensory/regulatory protein RpfC n=1 Tax=Magnetofaba australis IT-1 TaxID=1434232 RepID=A0A1Y2K1R9_9PROT|nr:putative multi-sensor hybrid histidine kinase [Magnetofaba australis IT-1]